MTLWVLVPSRGRPASVARLSQACAVTCQADTRLHFAFDDDDPALDQNLTAAAGHLIEVGKRTGLVAWTNMLAQTHLDAGDAAALASFGDDMLPVTPGWDERLLAALPRGGGISYPNDYRRSDIPEAPVVSVNIVEALGRFFPLGEHWFGDTALGDIGRMAGCLVYCPDVIVEHLHPNTRPDVTRHDQTYEDAAGHLNADMAAYHRWRLFTMQGDVAAVRAACSPAAA